MKIRKLDLLFAGAIALLVSVGLLITPAHAGQQALKGTNGAEIYWRGNPDFDAANPVLPNALNDTQALQPKVHVSCIYSEVHVIVTNVTGSGDNVQFNIQSTGGLAHCES